MSSLALLELEIPYHLNVKGKNNVDFVLALMVAVVAFPLGMASGTKWQGVEVAIVEKVH